MASKSISDFLTMPEELQLAMLLMVQNGAIAISGMTKKIESVAADYWSGRQGLGQGNTSIFPFRRTDPAGNTYVVHRDALLYINLLFTGTNIDFLYEYKIKGLDGEYSQELKDVVRDAVVQEQTTVTLSGALKCEAFSKSFRGYEELTPIAGVEVSASNPLEGSAVFHISKRTYDRIVRDEKDSWRELEKIAQRTPAAGKKRGTPAFAR